MSFAAAYLLVAAFPTLFYHIFMVLAFPGCFAKKKLR